MKLLKSIFKALLALTVLGLFCVSCAKEPQSETSQDDFSLMIVIEPSLDVSVDASVTFKFYSGKGPKDGDSVVLRPVTGGSDLVCEITAIHSDSFTFKIPEGISSGTYSLFVKRGTATKKVGDLYFNVVSVVKVEQKEGFNVYGIVTCEDKGVEGVLISDGVQFTKTDKDGLYYLASSEYTKNVFMVVPSGYEAAREGVMAKFFGPLDGNTATYDRVDFNLVEVGDQKNHIVYFMGDMHLANRNNDIAQFDVFISDIQEQINANSGVRQYGITLGDMSWDQYWYDNKYDLYNYVETINKIEGISLFNTIGNHDHDMLFGGDYDTVDAYRKCIGPNYYSFNAGDIHYVILDNILCTNTPSTDGSGRTYKNDISADQLDWLRKDLEYVDKSKTLVITGHAQFYNDKGAYSNAKTSELESIVAGYKEVHFMSAHTHVLYNVDKLDSKGTFEHNSSAVCGTWWWTGRYTAGLYLSKDGVPSGYYIYNMNGADVKWRYKGIRHDLDYQFRTYDRNSIDLSASKVAAGAPDSYASTFETSAGHWVGQKTDNTVYFNIFDYDPSWKIEVTENGKQLEWQNVREKDPLHLCAYEAKRAANSKAPTSSFKTYSSGHIFKVTASSATSTLEFKITNRFGEVFTETMTRPKNFSVSGSYK